MTYIALLILGFSTGQARNMHALSPRLQVAFLIHTDIMDFVHTVELQQIAVIHAHGCLFNNCCLILIIQTKAEIDIICAPCLGIVSYSTYIYLHHLRHVFRKCWYINSSFIELMGISTCMFSFPMNVWTLVQRMCPSPSGPPYWAAGPRQLSWGRRRDGRSSRSWAELPDWNLKQYDGVLKIPQKTMGFNFNTKMV